MLTKGLNYVPVGKSIPKDEYIVNIENRPQQLAPGGHFNYLHHQISNILAKAKPQSPNLTKDQPRAILELKKDKSTVIVPADKGNATAVLDKSNFDDLVNNLLNDPTT